MTRTADKPGTYRVRQKGGEWVVSGVRNTGQRVRLRAHSPDEAERLAVGVFGAGGGIGPILHPQDVPAKSGVAADAGPIPVDDWGFPVRVSADVASTVAASFNLPNSSVGGLVPGPVQPTDKEELAKKAHRAKYAKSLMEMAGMGYAAGTVMVARRVVTNGGKEPVNPNPKQVQDLADCTKETFIEWFGDREIKPWQMMFLLTLGIPIAMWLQSPKTKVQPESKLKSVP